MRFCVLVFLFLICSHSWASSYQVSKLWEQHLDQTLLPHQLELWIEQSDLTDLELIDQLRLQKMQLDLFGQKVGTRFLADLTNQQSLQLASELDLLGLPLEFSQEARASIEKAHRRLQRIGQGDKLTRNQIKQLLNFTPDHAQFYQGEYQDTISLYLFCRKDRNYPCRFVLKDRTGEFVQEQDQLWTLPALAKSKYNLGYNITRGQTPMGVHRIDSVMPFANNQFFYGTFRRVILNWVDGADSDKLTKVLLPSEHHSLKWWKQASVARTVGRTDLRIHGTGQINTDPKLSYYPHIPTSGCVSTLEGQYGETTFMDQRLLLDQLMLALQLGPVYDNEVQIKGLLYVVELDDQKKAVSAEEIASLIQ